MVEKRGSRKHDDGRVGDERKRHRDILRSIAATGAADVAAGIGTGANVGRRNRHCHLRQMSSPFSVARCFEWCSLRESNRFSGFQLAFVVAGRLAVFVVGCAYALFLLGARRR